MFTKSFQNGNIFVIKNERKKEITNFTRSEIIHENFFSELKNENISNSKYARDNSIDRTILSKCKNMTTSMNPDQIGLAAKYLHITVNDLCYTSEEKKEINVLSKSIEYNPNLAKQNIVVKLYREIFSNPLKAVVSTVTFGIVVFIIVLFGTISSGFWEILFSLIALSFLYLHFFEYWTISILIILSCVFSFLEFCLIFKK